MARQKKPRVKRESALASTAREAETKAIQNWLRGMDTPLVKEKGNREAPEPKEE